MDIQLNHVINNALHTHTPIMGSITGAEDPSTYIKKNLTIKYNKKNLNKTQSANRFV